MELTSISKDEQEEQDINAVSRDAAFKDLYLKYRTKGYFHKEALAHAKRDWFGAWV